jgi:hypothetical protein
VVQTGTSSLFSGVVSDTAQLFQLPATSDNIEEFYDSFEDAVGDNEVDDDHAGSESDESDASFKSAVSAAPDFGDIFTDSTTALFSTTNSLFRGISNIFDKPEEEEEAKK